MKAVLIVLIVICAVLALFYAVGLKFVRVLILRQDNFPTPETGARSSNLLEPTGDALWAHNIPYFKPFRELPFEEISIDTDDGLTLRADLLRGTGTGVTVMFFHGYKSEPACDFAAMYDFYKSLGHDLIYVHIRAHGKSDGTYIGFGALDRYDIVKWTDKAAELFPDNDIYLHGMSMGAASVLQSMDHRKQLVCKLPVFRLRRAARRCHGNDHMLGNGHDVLGSVFRNAFRPHRLAQKAHHLGLCAVGNFHDSLRHDALSARQHL